MQFQFDQHTVQSAQCSIISMFLHSIGHTFQDPWQALNKSFLILLPMVATESPLTSPRQVKKTLIKMWHQKSWSMATLENTGRQQSLGWFRRAICRSIVQRGRGRQIQRKTEWQDSCNQWVLGQQWRSDDMADLMIRTKLKIMKCCCITIACSNSPEQSNQQVAI